MVELQMVSLIAQTEEGTHSTNLKHKTHVIVTDNSKHTVATRVGMPKERQADRNRHTCMHTHGGTNPHTHVHMHTHLPE